MFNALFYLYSHFIDVTCIPVRANVQIQHLNPENKDSIYPTHWFNIEMNKMAHVN